MRWTLVTACPICHTCHTCHVSHTNGSPMRSAPSAVLLSVLTPLAVVALPVVSAPHPAPHPVHSTVRSQALHGVELAAVGSRAVQGSARAAFQAFQATGQQAAPGRTVGRPDVLVTRTHVASFDLLGVTWHRATARADLPVLVRTHGHKGWTGWTALDVTDTPAGSEGNAARPGTEPLWVGDSDGYQVRVDVVSGALPRGLRVDLVDPGSSDADTSVGAGRPMQYRHLKQLAAERAAHAKAFKAQADSDEGGEDPEEIAEQAEQWAEARSAPGIVAPGAYSAAWQQQQSLPHTGGSWTHLTKLPYNSDDPRYRDVESNSSGGAGLVTGRVTGLAADNRGDVYAGAANGGVWRSTGGGGHWTPISEKLPTPSTGDLRLDGWGRLWYATGEANTSATSFVGTGVYVLSNPRSGSFTPSLPDPRPTTIPTATPATSPATAPVRAASRRWWPMLEPRLTSTRRRR